MSRAPGFNRWFIVTVAVVVGFLIGAAAVVYVTYAWVPADFILRDAPPRFLRFDPNGERPDYRDVYVARVAARYVRDLQAGQPDAALEQAQRALGVTVGDATPIEALAMASSAEQVARKENARDGDNPDQGWFTLVDQSNLTQLVEQLEQVKDQPPVIAGPVIEARTNMRIFGGLMLLLWVALCSGVLLFVANWLKPELVAGARTAAAPPSPSPSVPPAASAVGPGSGQVAGVPASAPTEPGAFPAPSAPPASRAAPPASRPAEPFVAPSPYSSGVSGMPSPASGESFINTFRAVYQHGQPDFDEGFQISGSSGELIGECGVSVADRVTLTSPERVTALAIWAFDKNDFQSTAKLVLTPYAYRNDIIRNKLAPRGELVLAAPTIFEIVTSTLRVEVEVRGLHLRPLDGDPNGYFEHAEFEFRVYRKPPASAH